MFGGGGLFNNKPEAPKAQTEDEIGVPVPVTGRVSALKGHEVQFEIRAESKTPGATVEFLIRTFPSAGKIVSIVSKPNERSKALVTYYADPASSATSDAFAFAVRYRGGRYSSEMRYDIDLTDLKAEIQAPPAIEFGKVTIGSEEVREVIVKNIGNGSVERQIFLSSPWVLIEPADGMLRIGPRGARVLEIAFRPELTGETSYSLSFSRSQEGTTKLIGTGGEPFLIEKDTLELTLDSLTGERKGEIELSNPGTKTVVLAARASTRLQNSLSESYLVASGKSTLVPVRLASTDTAPFDGTVQFFLENGYSKSIRVIAPVVPGKIVVTVPNAISSEVINYGQVEAGRSAERGITLTNEGGVSVPLEMEIPEPFRLLNAPGSQLAPQASVQISVGVFPGVSRRGLVDETMNVFYSDETVPIRLLANVVTPSKVPSGSNGAGGVMGSQLARPMRLSSAGVSSSAPVPPSPDREKVIPGPSAVIDPIGSQNQATVVETALRQPEDLSVLSAESHSLVIGWTAPKDSDESFFKVELRKVGGDTSASPDEGRWSVYPAVKFERIDRLVKASITPLVPESDYEFRVSQVNSEGRTSLPSAILAARTIKPVNWVVIGLISGLSVVLLGLGLAAIHVVKTRGHNEPSPLASDLNSTPPWLNS